MHTLQISNRHKATNKNKQEDSNSQHIFYSLLLLMPHGHRDEIHTSQTKIHARIQ